MIILGIDPGASGAYCLLDGGSISVRPFPMNGKELHAAALVSFWYHLGSGAMNCVGVIEQQHARPISSRVAMFSLGRNYGTLLGILTSLGIGTEIVPPQQWKKEILHGTDKDKDAAIAYVSRKYPHVDLTEGGRHKPHDGMADAVCLAEFGRRRYAGNPPPQDHV